MYNKLQADLSKNFTLVNRPGPDVMALRLVLMDATTAVPGLRSVSVIVPQARVLNGLQSLATGSYAFAGSAEAEMKLTDSSTNELLAAAVDERAGGMRIKSAASFRWGDAEKCDGLLGRESFRPAAAAARKVCHKRLTGQNP